MIRIKTRKGWFDFRSAQAANSCEQFGVRAVDCLILGRKNFESEALLKAATKSAAERF